MEVRKSGLKRWVYLGESDVVDGQDGLVEGEGELFAGQIDIQRSLFNLHRKMVPTEVMREKAYMYVDAGLVSRVRADVMLRVIEAERNWSRMINDVAPDQDDDAAGTARLNHTQLTKLLHDREAKLQSGAMGGETDQWRVYSFIIDHMQQSDKYLRLVVQASAGACCEMMH